METYLIDLKKKVQEIKNRTEVASMKEEITKFIQSSQFEQLPEEEKDFAVDLLAHVNSKQDQFTGCDPINLLSRPGGFDE